MKLGGVGVRGSSRHICIGGVIRALFLLETSCIRS